MLMSAVGCLFLKMVILLDERETMYIVCVCVCERYVAHVRYDDAFPTKYPST